MFKNPILSNLAIKYLYGEASVEEKAKIINHMDDESEEVFFELLNLKANLDDAAVEPSNRTIQNILSYSRALNEETLT